MLEILALMGVGAAGALALWWRAARRRAGEREQLWRNLLDALATRDFRSARALSQMLEDEAGISRREVLLRVQRMENHEGEQQAARRELEDVLASLQDAVLVVDAAARLRFLNAAALGLFGVRVEDVLGAQLLEALPSFELEAAVRAALQDGQSSARETSLYMTANHPHERREVLLRAAPVRRGDGAISGAVAIVQDLTELRRLERVRRDFVANASHELRTPIANIRAAAETILHAPDDARLVQRFLPQLVGEAERLSRLVTDLLELARADAQIEAPQTPVDVASIARGVAHQLRDKAAQQNIAVRCEGQAPVCVPGDGAALEQVIFNLLDNALMYTPPGGSVTLGARRDGANVLLWVSDTGIGIPPEDLARIFERFYRVDKARSRARGGTGLGLAIVKHIVENHGGHVKVESAVGQGSTFTVTLPATA